MPRRFFASTSVGLEHLLAGELAQLGAEDVRERHAGVAFAGELATAYRACLWSRLASRVLLPLTDFRVESESDLYEGVRIVDWLDHLDDGVTMAVSFTGTNDTIRDTMFGAQRVKDAIVDQLRERCGARPSVDARHPDVRVFARLRGDRATVGLDLSGDALHRRGYREPGKQTEAPLKETLAAAVLIHGGWPPIAAAGGALVDPVCGSGTLPIEAALIAADAAPGLLRAERAAASTRAFGLERWRGHERSVWRALVAEAASRRDEGLARIAAGRGAQPILGLDHDPRAVSLARAGVRRAGLDDVITIERAELAALKAPPVSGVTPPGLVAANLPYGERLGRRDDLTALYALFGTRLRASFGGWRAAVLAGDRELGRALGLRSRRPLRLRNGPLPCVLLDIDVPAAGAAPAAGERRQPVSRTGQCQLADRLRRNLRHVGKTMRRQGVTCYRLYDADLPEYNVAVDVYGHRLHVQEYAPPPEIDVTRAAARLADAIDTVAEVTGVARRDIVVKQRRRQRGAAQYRRRGAGSFQTVTEDGLAYLVDLESYLDTGLFLDQRETRRLIRRLAGGRRFLNLFAYTSTATVCAVAGGAPATTSVDLSATYLEWSRRNLDENGVTDVVVEPTRRRQGAQPPARAAHRLVQADCLGWIGVEEAQYDLILLDPPTFSNSKRMGGVTFDVQRDHADLIRMTVRRLLAPRGVLLFCSNRRGFRMDRSSLVSLKLRDLSRATLAPDFARRVNAHHVWQITPR